MSTAKQEMQRMSRAAGDAMNELNRKVSAATGAAREALKVEQNKATRLYAEASDKEIAAALNETQAGATASLAAAAETLAAEVTRLKQSTAHLTALGNALDTGTSVVKLFVKGD